MHTAAMRSRVPLLACLVGLGLGLAAAACGAPYRFGGSCSEIACGDGFFVEFEHEGEWQAGTYRVEVDLDDETFACEVEMPLDCDAPPACAEDSPIIVSAEGCALDPSVHALGGVSMVEGPTPETVAVRVFLDDATVGEAEFEPVFTQSFPNGGSCPPICDEAEPASMSVD